MRVISVVSVFAIALMVLAATACDSMPGMGGGQQPVPQVVPPMQGIPPLQMPAQPGVPGQLPQALPTIPGVQIPGQPAPLPGMPVAAQPAVPGQPAVAAPVAPVAPIAPVAPPLTGDLLTDRVNEVKFQQAPDKTATSALTKVLLGATKVQSYQVQLPGPPYCHTFVAAGDDAVKNVDVVLESPLAVPEAMDSSADNKAIIANHCPTMPGLYKLTVKMVDGQGEVAIQVFSK